MKSMVSAETMLNHPYLTIPLTVHTDESDKQVGAVISKNNKPTVVFSRILSKKQLKYTKTKKELLTMVECLKQFRGILFG